MAKEKEQLRRIMRAKRSLISGAERERLSHMACKRLLATPLWKDANAVALFVSLSEEISSRELLEQAFLDGKQLYLPKISPVEKGFMDFYECASLSDLKKRKFGLLEPDASGKALSRVDLMIVPGLAFDRSGNRLGYGGGYYDRYLSLKPQLHGCCLGFGYAFQILDSVPGEEYDYKMSLLCTEEEVIWSKA